MSDFILGTIILAVLIAASCLWAFGVDALRDGLERVFNADRDFES